MCGNHQIQSFPVQPRTCVTGTAIPFLARAAKVFKACGCRTCIIHPSAARPESQLPVPFSSFIVHKGEFQHSIFHQAVSFHLLRGAFFFSFYFLENIGCVSALQFSFKSYEVLSISVDGKIVPPPSPPHQPLRFLPVLNCFDLQSERFNWRD